MSGDILQSLVKDADLVASVGVRLGKIKDPAFLATLAAAKDSLATGAAEGPQILGLQKSLNGAINDIYPITLGDLRSGWSPFDVKGLRISTYSFGLISIVLLFMTAYITQVYGKANSIYEATTELENSKGGEQQTIRLFGLIKKNRKDLIESMKTGEKDFLYEAFNTALSELELQNLKFQIYNSMINDSVTEIDFGRRLAVLLPNALRAGSTGSAITSAQSTANAQNDPSTTDFQISHDDLATYGQTPPMADATKPSTAPSGPLPGITDMKKALAGASDAAGDRAGTVAKAVDQSFAGLNEADLGKMDETGLLEVHLAHVKQFTASIGVQFNPISPMDYTFLLFQLKQSLTFFGSWLLPGLYGMLGAVTFQLRRIMDYTVPEPPFIRLLFRIVLGGFAGIIFVWFWSPATAKSIQPVFSTLSVFGFAFIFGFSTDIFFQALDRLIAAASQTFGKVGP